MVYGFIGWRVLVVWFFCGGIDFMVVLVWQRSRREIYCVEEELRFQVVCVMVVYFLRISLDLNYLSEEVLIYVWVGFFYD